MSPHETRLLELLEEVLDTQRSPAEVCAQWPELLPELERRVARCQSLDAELSALFPAVGANATPLANDATSLPSVPGYELLSVLGRGGIGIVYRARHLLLHRTVALKMLLAGEVADPAEYERLRCEARTIAALCHPNIVKVFDVGDVGGQPFFTMELIEGGTLAHRIDGKPQPTRVAATLLRSLAMAMAVAHDAGIVHRDLKPANVLMDRDGTPKISDFGLARLQHDDLSQPPDVARLGTPSYMAPEQIRGDADAAGPSVDVYALGAILYEMLVGEPPFRGPSAVETQRRILTEDAVPPSQRRNAVPRDLNVICLKCLNRSPARRYLTTAALADDLDRYLRGEPIKARPTNLVERGVKLVKRKPLATVACVAVVVTIGLGTLLANGLPGARSMRAQSQAMAEADLSRVVDLQEHSQWADAKHVLERAGTHLGVNTPTDLKARLDRAQSDLDVAMVLDAIHLNRSTSGNLPVYRGCSDRAYEAAFRSAGFEVFAGTPESVAEAIRASSIRAPLLAALDDWAGATDDVARFGRLLAIARSVDPDPNGWRDRIRDPAHWQDPAALKALALTLPAEQVPVSLLLMVSDRLRVTVGEPPSFLERVQKAHPEDFWANLTLGNVLLWRVPEQANGYFRIAMARRPNAAVSFNAMADVFRVERAPYDAITYYRRALQIEPTAVRATNSLGNAMRDIGRLDESIALHQHALQLDPDYAWARVDLAVALHDLGRLKEATAQLKIAAEAQPNDPNIVGALRGAQVVQGDGAAVLAAWREQLQASPAALGSLAEYAELALFLGNEDEYRRVRTEALAQAATTTDMKAAQSVAQMACLLPADTAEVQAAGKLADRAVVSRANRPDRSFKSFLFAQGLAQYRAGRLDNAIATMTGGAAQAVGPCSQLIVAMALKESGHDREALAALATAVLSYDWRPAQADRRDAWMSHTLRREAEAKILPGLKAVLDGGPLPDDRDELLAMIGEAQFLQKPGLAAGLFARACDADPEWAKTLNAGVYFRAACAAAAARRGATDEVAALHAQHSLAWLRAAFDRQLALIDGNAVTRARIERDIGQLRTEPDLDVVRSDESLRAMLPAEREAFAAFWAEVDAALKRLEGMR